MAISFGCGFQQFAQESLRFVARMPCSLQKTHFWRVSCSLAIAELYTNQSSARGRALRLFDRNFGQYVHRSRRGRAGSECSAVCLSEPDTLWPASWAMSDSGPMPVPRYREIYMPIEQSYTAKTALATACETLQHEAGNQTHDCQHKEGGGEHQPQPATSGDQGA